MASPEPNAGVVRLCQTCRATLCFQDNINSLRETAPSSPGSPSSSSCLEPVSDRGDEAGPTRDFREDRLPDLPGLRTSARAGCDFCLYLRNIILTSPYGTERTALQQRLLGRGTVRLRLSWQWSPPAPARAGRTGSTSRARGLQGLLIFLEIPISRWTRVLSGTRQKHHLFTFPFTVEAVPGEDATAYWLGLAPPLPQDYLHHQRVAWMRQMLEDCEKHGHGLMTEGYIPERLLDVRPRNPRLVLRDELDVESQTTHGIVPYAALSYCWGSREQSQNQLKTTSTSLQDRKTGIHDAKMTSSLRDAVAATRALGLPYLWVDALCILQDDMSDWERQCVNMTSIYGNAAVTLVASSSASCVESFLRQTGLRIRFPFQSTRQPSVVGSFFLEYHGGGPDDMGPDRRGPRWGSRGWTFQETTASRRQFYFGARHLHFECASGTTTMGFEPVKPTPLLSTNLGQGRLDLLAHAPDKTAAYGLWSRILAGYAAYSDSSFTAPTDLLPALSGLASHFHETLQEPYLCGFWQGNLASDLMWQLDEISILPAAPRRGSHVPSWSMLGRGQPFSWVELASRITVATFPAADIELLGSEPFGAVKKAELRVRSWVLDLTSLQGTGLAADFLAESTIWGFVSHGAHDGGAFVEFGLDEKHDKKAQRTLLRAPGGLSLLLLGTCKPPNSGRGGIDPVGVFGLVLQPVPGTDKFQRCGTFEPMHIKEQDFDGLALFKQGSVEREVIVI